MPVNQYDSKVILALGDWNWMNISEISGKSTASHDTVRKSLSRLAELSLVTNRESRSMEYNLTEKGLKVYNYLIKIEEVLKYG